MTDKAPKPPKWLKPVYAVLLVGQFGLVVFQVYRALAAQMTLVDALGRSGTALMIFAFSLCGFVLTYGRRQAP
jgi:hypothetical protein